MEVYRESTRVLVPVPSRPHYMVSPHLVTAVLRGMLPAAGSHGVDTGARLVALWRHECRRVFGDRIVDAPTRRCGDTYCPTCIYVYVYHHHALATL